MKRSGRPKRKTPLRARGSKARRESPTLAIFRLELRSRGWCDAQGVTDESGVPVCGHGRAHRGEHPHHVWPEDRDCGIHQPLRGLWLCAASHRWAHAHPKVAARVGLLRPMSGVPGVPIERR